MKDSKKEKPVSSKKSVKQNSMTANGKNDPEAKVTHVGKEEYEESRSPEFRMKQQPLNSEKNNNGE